MAAQTITGSTQTIHRTLSTTVEDRVTISGVAVSLVRVTNRNASAPLWAKALSSVSDPALVAAADGATWVGPGTSQLMSIGYATNGSAYLAVVGSATEYTVEAVAQVKPRLVVTPTEAFTVAVGDNITALTVGTNKESFRMPFACTLINLRASLITASSAGIPIIDVNKSGVSLMLTDKLSVDATELTSKTAATLVGITDAAIPDDAPMSIDIDVAGTGATGLKVTFYVVRT